MWAVWLALKYFQWVMTYFVVTSRRVIYRTGVISKKGVEIPLERINNINFHQRIIDRIIGAGDLDIESAGATASPTSTSSAIPTACSTRSTGRWRRATCRSPWCSRRRRASRLPPGCRGPDQIEQLAKLRDQGHITEAEFETKKAELLGRM